MKNEKILKMIENGQIDELKKELRDEIFQDEIKKQPSMKERYSAMKRYFKYSQKESREVIKRPCKNLETSIGTYNAFTDGFSFVLTKEQLGEIEEFDNSKKDYFNMDALIKSIPQEYKEIDLNLLISKAKSLGYKYKKSEIGTNGDFQYVFKYKDGYYKVGLLDKAYSIIKNEEKAKVYYTGNESLLYIKTNIGLCGILPLNHTTVNQIEKAKTVIVLNDDGEIEE